MACPGISESRVYPRVCGGTVAQRERHAGVVGLSPRVRGNQQRPAAPTCRPRSIPACAGEPAGLEHIDLPEEVYPRVCGGTEAWLLSVMWCEGLSPRVRGNLLVHQAGLHYGRSIPACAGEPGHSQIDILHCQVYPRVCGGTPAPPEGGLLGKGLSPRVRGNPSTPGAPTSLLRSIPACAGEPAQ